MAENWQEWISFRLDWTQLCATESITMTVMILAMGDVCVCLGITAENRSYLAFHPRDRPNIDKLICDQEYKNEHITYYLANWHNIGLDDDQIFLALLSSLSSSYSSSSPLFDLKAELWEQLLKIKITQSSAFNPFHHVHNNFSSLEAHDEAQEKIRLNCSDALFMALAVRCCKPHAISFVTPSQLPTFNFKLTFTLFWLLNDMPPL